MKKMKKTTNSARFLSALLAVLLLMGLASCQKENKTENVLWETAQYLEDCTLGDGKTEFFLDVQAGEKTVRFTIQTDKEFLAEALLENDLAEGEDSAYGLYVKTVNGITADYDKDQSYWALMQNGVATAYGVSQAELTDGATYALVYTK